MTSAVVVLTPRTTTSRVCDSISLPLSTYEPLSLSPIHTHIQEKKQPSSKTEQNQTKQGKRKENKSKTSIRSHRASSQLSLSFTFYFFSPSFLLSAFSPLSFTISLFTFPLLIFTVIARSAGRNRFYTSPHTHTPTLRCVFFISLPFLDVGT